MTREELDKLKALVDSMEYMTNVFINGERDILVKAIKALEQTRWIPVSERLPKEDNEVLITIKSCGKWYVCHSVYRDGLFWQKNFEFNSYRNPIAWMPLPEPYKASPTGAEGSDKE